MENSVVISPEPPDLELATVVTSAGFVQPLTLELREDVEKHIAEGRMVYSVKRQNELVGYALFRTFGPVLYLGGIMIAPALQGQGLAAQIIKRASTDSGLRLLGLRTQSLRMWATGNRLTSCWQPHASVLDADLTNLGHHLAESIGCSFPCTPGFYGGQLYGVKPVHTNTLLQAWWDTICNFERGDAIVCVGRLR